MKKLDFAKLASEKKDWSRIVILATKINEIINSLEPVELPKEEPCDCDGEEWHAKGNNCEPKEERETCPNCIEPSDKIRTISDEKCKVCGRKGYIVWQGTGYSKFKCEPKEQSLSDLKEYRRTHEVPNSLDISDHAKFEEIRCKKTNHSILGCTDETSLRDGEKGDKIKTSIAARYNTLVQEQDYLKDLFRMLFPEDNRFEDT